MAIETQLKQLILDKYGSIRAFTQILNFPYSTIDSMLKRGLGGTSVSTVLAVCLALNIDIEGLLNGQIVPKPSFPTLSLELQKLNNILSQLNEEGQAKLLDYAADLVASGRYKEGTSAASNKTNVVKFAARNGELTEERLTDEEVAARMASDDLLPDAEL